MKPISSILDSFGRPITAYSDVYDGARATRHHGYVPRADRDTSQTLDQWTRRQMLSVARGLYENVGFVKGAVRDIARYSVGSGLLPQSQIKDRPVRDAYESFWREWSKIPEVSGLHNYAEVCRMRSIAVDVDGDIGQIYTETPTGFPQIQLIRSHRIESSSTDNGSEDGVKTDGSGFPLSYSIRISNSKGSEDYRSISARNFMLLADRDAPDQQRGKTAFHHALNTIRDISEILSAERIGVKVNSTLAMVLKVSAGENNAGNGSFFGGQSTLSVGGKDLNLDRMMSGAIPRLEVGESIDSHASDRPSPTFTGFLSYLLRDVATGLQVPIEFLWDSSTVGGAMGRLITAKAQRKFEERQALLIKAATRDWGYVVSKAVKRGDLPYHEDWWRVNWQTPRKITVDEGRDAKENRQDIFSGLRTKAEDYGERGHDWMEAGDAQEKELNDLLERAGRLAKAHSITLDKAIELLQQRSPNPVSMPPQNNPDQKLK